MGTLDPDGRFVFALPLLPYAVAAVAATATVAFGAHMAHKTSRDLSGWKHQQRQDRKAKQELDQAQANVQKSINENFPDPDNYDPNDGPNFRNDKHKGLQMFLGVLVLINENSPIIEGIMSSKKSDSTDNTPSDDSVATDKETKSPSDGSEGKTNDKEEKITSDE